MCSVDLIPGTRFMKRLVCRLCGQRVYEVSEKPSEAEVNREVVGLRAHFEFSHGLAIEFYKCKKAH